jgi:hypothetical protein
VSNFADRDPKYPDLPTALCEWDPGFARSPEAAAVAHDFELPTVVADAFGDYVLRLNSTGDDDQALERALSALERMSGSEDRDLRNCALVGLIERLPNEAPGLIEALGPASADLYRRWDKRL